MADKYVKIFLLLRYKLFLIKLYLVYYLHFISLYLLILLSLFITVLSYFQYICLIEMFQKLGEVSPVSREQDGIQKRFYISVCVLIYWKLKLVLGHVYKELLSYIISCNIERWKRCCLNYSVYEYSDNQKLLRDKRFITKVCST